LLPEIKSFHVYFLLNTQDIEYIQDDIRIEDVALRQRLQDAYLSLLTGHDLPYIRVSGTVMQRKEIIDRMLMPGA
jgi:nicotinamide riboside kinase